MLITIFRFKHNLFLIDIGPLQYQIYTKREYNFILFLVDQEYLHKKYDKYLIATYIYVDIKQIEDKCWASPRDGINSFSGSRTSFMKSKVPVSGRKSVLLVPVLSLLNSGSNLSAYSYLFKIHLPSKPVSSMPSLFFNITFIFFYAFLYSPCVTIT